MAATLLFAVVGCGAEDWGSSRSTTSTVAAAPLPFGLHQVDGTEVIGMPISFRGAFMTYAGQPVTSDRLEVAYRVTGDPESVMREWAAQMADLGIGGVLFATPASDSGPSATLEAQAMVADGPGPGRALAELWPTDGDPILLVSIDRHVDQQPAAEVPFNELALGRLRSSKLSWKERGPGSELFTEQRDRMLVPDGAHTLTPTLPTRGGTGGSTTVLAAEDPDAAVGALLDQARSLHDFGDVTGPDVSDSSGSRVVSGSFVIPAGGWGFEVVAIEGPGQASATVWVRSYAD